MYQLMTVSACTRSPKNQKPMTSWTTLSPGSVSENRRAYGYRNDCLRQDQRCSQNPARGILYIGSSHMSGMRVGDNDARLHQGRGPSDRRHGLDWMHVRRQYQLHGDAVDRDLDAHSPRARGLL